MNKYDVHVNLDASDNIISGDELSSGILTSPMPFSSLKLYVNFEHPLN